jgi:hypothetical protein
LTVVDILAQPDDYIDDPGDDGAWAIGGRTQATLLAEGLGQDRGAGAARVMHAGDRVTEELVFLLAHTLPSGIGVVLARGFDRVALDRVARQEGVA